MRVHSALQPGQREDGTRCKHFDFLRRERIRHQYGPGTTNDTASNEQTF